MMPWISDAFALLAAILTWRVSRLVSATLVLACVASVVYAFAPWEPLRWSSALVGLAGAVEMARGSADATLVFPGELPIRGELPRIQRRAWLGLFCFASMVGDGSAMLVWKSLGEWVMPVAQICVCAAICAIAKWPERRPK